MRPGGHQGGGEPDNVRPGAVPGDNRPGIQIPPFPRPVKGDRTPVERALYWSVGHRPQFLQANSTVGLQLGARCPVERKPDFADGLGSAARHGKGANLFVVMKKDTMIDDDEDCGDA